jgi:aspartate oxidase
MTEYTKIKTQVAVIGGGLTGSVAAFELAGAGVDVTVVRDGRGASPHVAGFNVAGAESGDSTEIFIKDTHESATGLADAELVDILCNGSTALPKYLETLGFAFDTHEDGTLKARKSLGSSFARVVGKGNSSGAQILSLIDAELRQRENVKKIEGARAVRLFCRDGQVSGVLVYERATDSLTVIESPCVLLASGGYAGIFPFTSNTRDISGDTVAMALFAGAHATDMEFVQFEPSCAVWPESIRGKGMITTLFYEGATMTNALGERFMLRHSPDGERVNKDVLARAIARELREGRATEHGGVYFDATGVDKERMLSAYAPFVKRYENVGMDLLSQPVEVANAAHTSLGGVKVDGRCQSDVAGLWAAGEALGNLHGANRIGGSAGTETLVFGVHAANSIKNGTPRTAAAVSDSDIEALCERTCPTLSPVRAARIRTEVSAILGEHLGVEREATGLSVAVDALEKLYGEVVDASCECEARALFEKLSLENLVLTALALAKSALLRDDSAGSHLRIDRQASATVPYRTDAYLDGKNVCVSKIYK